MKNRLRLGIVTALVAGSVALASAGLSQEGAAAALREAAERGDSQAQFKLAARYFFGEGVGRNYEEAIRWFRRAAEQGLTEAQWWLGWIYGGLSRYNKDLPLNYVEAARWYRRAAEQGDAGAQNALGELYRDGDGVEHDDREAVQWFRAAAEQGKREAQFNLAKMYRDGRGVPQDFVSAHMWANLAASQGVADIDRYVDHKDLERLRRYYPALREDIAQLMTPDQLEEAQARARRWRPRPRAGVSAGGVEGEPQTGEPDSLGTGFWISRDGHFPTNYHVVEGCRKIILVGPQWREQVKVHLSDHGNDLAILGPAVPAPGIISFSESERPELGQGVVVVGYPLQGLLSGLNVTTGNVSALAGVQDDSRMIQITAPVQAGNSGGPLLDTSGNVIGVVTSKLDSLKVAVTTGDVPQNVNFAIKAAIVCTFLDSNGIPYSTQPSTSLLDNPVIADRVKKAVASVECWK